MRQRLIALILSAGILYSTPASAAMRLFPMWERKTCPLEEFACYDMDQTRMILKIDLDFQEKLNLIPKLEQNIADLKLSLQKNDTALQEELKAKSILETRYREKDKAFETTSLLYQKAKQRDVFGGAFPWVIAAGTVTLALGFLGGFYVHAKL